MNRAAFMALLAALTLGPVPEFLHDAFGKNADDCGRSQICSPADHHHDSDCDICQSLASRSPDRIATFTAAVAVEVPFAVVAPHLTLRAAPTCDIPCSRAPPSSLI